MIRGARGDPSRGPRFALGMLAHSHVSRRVGHLLPLGAIS
jgi:hypothetical protein